MRHYGATTPRRARAHAPLLLLVLAIVLGQGGCADPQHRPVRVGVLIWPPYEMVYLASHLGYFTADEVQIVEFSAPADLFRAYLNGAVDAAPITSQFLLHALQTGPHHSAALLIDYSAGGDALLAKPHVTSVADLAGRTIAMESGTLGAYLLDRALEAGGLSRADVNIRFIDIPDQAAAFDDPAIDAVITYEPTVSALADRNATVLFDSNRIPLEIIDVLVVRRADIERHNRNLHKLVDGWLRARDYYMRNPHAAAAVVSGRQGLSPADFVEAMNGAVLLDRAANLRLLGGHDPALLAALEKQLQYMLDTGSLEKPVDLDGALDASLVKEFPR